MSNEKQNKIQSWQIKLDAMTTLPGEEFDKNQGWEKLQHRLEAKKRKKIATWYWAAACLLALLTIGFIFTQNDKPAFAKSHQLQNDFTTGNTTKSAPSKTLTFVKPVLQTLVTESAKEKLSKKLSAKPAKNFLKPIDSTTSKSFAENLTDPSEDIERIQLPDTPQHTTTIATVTKKLKVIHINELEPAPENLMTSKNIEPHSFRIKISKPVSAPLLPTIKEQYVYSLRIKLSTKK